jgi:hypothetical protein
MDAAATNLSMSQLFRNRLATPAFVQKQLQTAAAVGAMSYVYGLEAVKLKQVQQKLFDCYHGNPTAGMVPMVGDLMKGENAYSELWDRSDDGQATLKSRFMQKNDVLYYAGTHITISSLSTANQSTSVLADGRLIYSMAQNALKHGKKALSIEMDAYVDGKLPSGWNDDDLDQHILDGMWRLLNNSPVCDVDEERHSEDVDDNDDDAAANQAATNVSERPSDWVFPGWVAYLLFGPRAVTGFKSPLFEIGDWPKNKKNGNNGGGGRAEQRKAAEAQADTVRVNTAGRGVALAERKELVNIAQMEDRAEALATQSNLLALSQVINSKQKRVHTLTQMLGCGNLSDSIKDGLYDQVVKLMEEISEKENMMEAYHQKKRKTHTVVSELLSEQVRDQEAFSPKAQSSSGDATPTALTYS